MAGLILGSQASSRPKITGIQVTTSVLGACLPVVFGEMKIAGNLIWYGDFKQSGGSGTGKGGVISGGKASSNAPKYTAAVEIAICEGPINDIPVVYASKNNTTLAALGCSLFKGTSGQVSWGYLTSNHADQALGYRRIAYVAASSFDLGNSASLPNLNFEVQGFGWGAAVAGIPDADPSFVCTQLLTNTIWGAGSYYPAARVGDLTAFQTYCFAVGLFVSIALDSQRPVRDVLQEIADGCNSDWVYINDGLTLVPRGDETLTANGKTYTPVQAPLFSLTDDDFLVTSPTDQPVIRQRQRPSDQINLVQREFKNRGARYNPHVVEARHQAFIDQYGLRQSTGKASNIFAVKSYARKSAQLELQRQAIRNSYQFRLDARYACLDPTDIVAITDSLLGITVQWVRILDIEEQDDDTFVITAEEYLGGTGGAPDYTIDQGVPFVADYNSPPDPTATPVIFEPPIGLISDSEVWIGVAGSGSNWGSAQVWVSTDGVEYTQLGTVSASGNLGVLSASLAAVTPAAVGQTIDTTHTLSVDLTASEGSLTTSTVDNATALNTLCYVDGELLAFANANLSSGFTYNLTYLVRGNYSTTPGSHAAGSVFLKLDNDSVFKWPYTHDRVGQTIYVKLPAANIYGGAQQTIADVDAYAYTIKGNAVITPLANTANFREAFIDGKMWLYWDEIVGDNRINGYEIRKGSTWDSAQFLQQVAHPPIPAYGDDTYWVAGFYQPAPDTIYYSPTPEGLTVTGASLAKNVLVTRDEAGNSWTGTLDATLQVSGADVRTIAGQSFGYYTVAAGRRIAVGRAAYCPVAINWSLIGQLDSSDFLGVSDFLGQTDFIGFGATAQVYGAPEIRLSTDGGTTWGPWTKYAPGVYYFSNLDFRMGIGTNNPGVVSAFLAALTVIVNAPDRVDFFANTATSSSADTTINFSSTFNGGPGGASVPSWNVAIRDVPSGGGDTVRVTSISLSAITFSVYNGGSRVVRHCDVTIQGY